MHFNAIKFVCILNDKIKKWKWNIFVGEKTKLISFVVQSSYIYKIEDVSMVRPVTLLDMIITKINFMLNTLAWVIIYVKMLSMSGALRSVIGGRFFYL